MTRIHVAPIGQIRRWLHRRAKRKAMLLAADGLSHLPDDVLQDIGVSRVDLACPRKIRISPV